MTGDFTKHLPQGPDITFPFRTVFQFVFHAALAIWEGLANIVSYYSSEFLLLCNYCDEKKTWVSDTEYSDIAEYVCCMCLSIYTR